jgi:hypothetical protein
VGTSETLQKLSPSDSSNKPTFGLLATLYEAQSEATTHQDSAILDSKQKTENESQVSSFLFSAFSLFHSVLNIPFSRQKLVPIQPKIERREAIRQRKAFIAAQLDNSIKKQLLSRLEKVKNKTKAFVSPDFLCTHPISLTLSSTQKIGSLPRVLHRKPQPQTL